MSTDAKTLYGILLDRMGLSVKNGWLDEQGRVYIIFPVQEVMDALGCADNKATKLFRELEKFGLIERKRLEAYFMQSLEVDLLLRVCPDEEDAIDQIVNLLVDTCSSKRRMLRVAGDDKPAEVVRSRFMKLNADHIEGILMTMTDSRTNYGREIDALIRQVYGSKIRVFEQPVPHSVRAAEISAEGRSIFAHDPKGKVAAAYQSLTREVLADAEKQRKLGAERSR